MYQFIPRIPFSIKLILANMYSLCVVSVQCSAEEEKVRKERGS